MMRNKKVQDYLVVLKNPNTTIVERTGWLLSALAILIITIQLLSHSTSIGLYVTLFVVLVFLISNIIEKRKNAKLNCFIRFKKQHNYSALD